MPTLLMALAGPMQSWGIGSRFDERETLLEPSKSGVIGLLCAAMGRDRSEPVDDLARTRMGVRVDREGRISFDFHTAGNVIKASSNASSTPTRSNLVETVVTRRAFLSDAVFLVGLEGEDGLLKRALAGLLDPKWPLYLGRKSFVPSMPAALPDGLSCSGLCEALAGYRYLVSGAPLPDSVRYVIESASGLERTDQPAGPFSSRAFGTRHVMSVTEGWGVVPNVPN